MQQNKILNKINLGYRSTWKTSGYIPVYISGTLLGFRCW